MQIIRKREEEQIMTYAKSTEAHLRNKISVITFISSLLVIWIHTFNLETYGIDASSAGIAKVVYYVENYWAKITLLAVPMFFTVSGFLFFRTFKLEALLDKYRSRAKSILIPYLCWCTIYYIYFVLLTNLPVVSSLMSGTERVAPSPVTWLCWLWPDSYYTLWFLKNLMGFIVLAPVIYVLLRDWNRKIPTGFAVLLVILLCVHFKWLSLWDGTNWYCLGAYVAINHKEWALYQNKTISRVSLVYILLVLFTAFRFWNQWLEILFFAAVWFALDLSRRDMTIRWWMKLTFFTYVAHDIFLEAYEKIFLLVFGTSPAFALVDYLIVPPAVFVTLVAIAAFLRKFMPRLWQLLTGART
jgi:hypothetical protein